MTNVFHMVYKTMPPQRGIIWTKNDPKENEYYFGANKIVFLSVSYSIAISRSPTFTKYKWMLHEKPQCVCVCRLKNTEVSVIPVHIYETCTKRKKKKRKHKDGKSYYNT